MERISSGRMKEGLKDWLPSYKDCPAHLVLMNEIYRDYWNPLQNFFLPTYKLKEKIRIGAKITKKYDKPQTPFARLINSSHLKDEQIELLKKTKENLNPFEPKAGLEIKLGVFFDRVRKIKTTEEYKKAA